MWPTIRRLAAAAVALGLLVGCGVLRPGSSALERQVRLMASDLETELIAALIITPDPEQTAVQYRLPGEDRWLGATRFAEWDEQLQPRSGMRMGSVPYAELETQLAELQNQCSDNPRVVAHVAPSGTLFAESRCGQEGAEQVLATWLNGVPQRELPADLSGSGDYALLYDEIVAAMPPGNIFQIAFPGPAGDQGAPVVVQGVVWLLSDRTNCQVRYIRNLDPQPGDPLRRYDCDGRGRQQGSDDRQDVLDMVELAQVDLAPILDEAVTASGFDPARVEYYVVMKLYIHGATVVVQTIDGEGYLHSF